VPDDFSLSSPAQAAAAGTRVDALKPGTRIWTYRIGKVLRHDAFCITYAARDAVLEHDVAITEYLPAHAAMRAADLAVVPRSTRWAEDYRWGRDRFLAEARTLAELAGTPGIAHVSDCLEANGTAYRVALHVAGETLSVRLGRQGMMPTEMVERLVLPLMGGLETAHAKGLLHLDIQPAKIIIDAQGNPTLVGFSAAQAALAARQQSITVIHTPGYAAIEQFSDGQTGPSTDVYGLAATLYHCVTGSVPVPAIKRLAEQLTPATQQAAGRYPYGLLAAIDAGLAFRSSDRPPSIATWRALFDTRASRSKAAAAPARPAAIAAVPVTEPPPRAQPTQPAVMPTSNGDRHRSVLTRVASRARRNRAATTFGGLASLAIVLGLAGGYVLRPSNDQAAHAVAERSAAAEAAAREQAAAEARRLAAEAEAEAAVARERAEAAARQEAEAAERAAFERRRSEAATRPAVEAEIQARADAEARRQQEAQAARQAAEEKARLEAAARQKAEAEAKARAEAEAKRQQEAEAARLAAEEKARLEALAREKADADARARAEADAKRQQEAAAARLATEEKARHEAAAREKADAEAKARAEADAKRQQEAAAARLATEEKARHEAAAREKADAEAKARAEADAKRQQETEAARLATEENARQEAAAREKADAEAKTRAEADAKRQQEAEAARLATEEKERQEAAAREKADAEAKARAEADTKRQQEAEAARLAAEEKERQGAAARRTAEEKARADATASTATDEAKRSAADEAARLAAEDAQAEAAVRQAVEDAARAEQAAARRAEEARLAAEQKAREEAAAKARAEAAARQKADAEAKRRAEAEKAEKAKVVTAADRRQADIIERGLRLSPRDRRRTQVALTALGFDTNGIDEEFGNRTRQMIAQWQKRQGAPDTGFLTAPQVALLQRQAAAALATYDADENQINQRRRRTELADVPPAEPAVSAAGNDSPPSMATSSSTIVSDAPPPGTPPAGADARVQAVAAATTRGNGADPAPSRLEEYAGSGRVVLGGGDNQDKVVSYSLTLQVTGQTVSGVLVRQCAACGAGGSEEYRTFVCDGAPLRANRGFSLRCDGAHAWGTLDRAKVHYVNSGAELSLTRVRGGS